jgi:hypothetical protein
VSSTVCCPTSLLSRVSCVMRMACTLLRMHARGPSLLLLPVSCNTSKLLRMLAGGPSLLHLPSTSLLPATPTCMLAVSSSLRQKTVLHSSSALLPATPACMLAVLHSSSSVLPATAADILRSLHACFLPCPFCSSVPPPCSSQGSPENQAVCVARVPKKMCSCPETLHGYALVCLRWLSLLSPICRRSFTHTHTRARAHTHTHISKTSNIPRLLCVLDCCSV